jgi:hypothetical protein
LLLCSLLPSASLFLTPGNIIIIGWLVVSCSLQGSFPPVYSASGLYFPPLQVLACGSA